MHRNASPSPALVSALLLLLLAACAGHRPQWVQPPDHSEAPPPLLLRGVRIFDGILGELSPPMDVLLARGRVVEVRPEGEITAPPGLDVLDGRGKTLLPGLVDADVRVAPEGALQQLEAQLAGGTMTAVIVGSGPEAASLQRSIVRGRSAGPRIFRSTRAIALGVEKDDPTGWGESGPVVPAATPLLAARAARRDLERLRPDLILVRMDGEAAPAALRAVVAEGRIYQKPVLALVRDAAGALAAADGGASAIVFDPHMPLLDEEAAMALSHANLPVIVAPAACASLAAAGGEAGGACRWRAAENARRLWEAGAPLLVGSGAGLPGLAPSTALRDSLAALVEAGVPAGEVLLMATSRPLRLLDPRAAFGVIVRRSYADLLLVDGDPLEDLSALGRIEARWQAGHRLHLLPDPEAGDAGTAARGR